MSETKFPIIIKLKKPVETGEDTQLEKIEIKREPTGGDWGQFNLGSPTMNDYLRVCSKITGIAVPVLKQVDTTASFRIVEVISDFLD